MKGGEGVKVFFCIAVFVIAAGLGAILYGLNADIFFGVLLGVLVMTFVSLQLTNKGADTTKK